MAPVACNPRSSRSDSVLAPVSPCVPRVHVSVQQRGECVRDFNPYPLLTSCQEEVNADTCNKVASIVFRWREHPGGV